MPYNTEEPKCFNHAQECFAYSNGKCKVLMDTEEYMDYCPFYKSRAQLEHERAISEKARDDARTLSQGIKLRTRTVYHARERKTR